MEKAVDVFVNCQTKSILPFIYFSQDFISNNYNSALKYQKYLGISSTGKLIIDNC